MRGGLSSSIFTVSVLELWPDKKVAYGGVGVDSLEGDNLVVFLLFLCWNSGLIRGWPLVGL